MARVSPGSKVNPMRYRLLTTILQEGADKTQSTARSACRSGPPRRRDRPGGTGASRVRRH